MYKIETKIRTIPIVIKAIPSKGCGKFTVTCFINLSTGTVINSTKLNPVKSGVSVPFKNWAKNKAVFSRKCVVISKGKKIRTARRLKKSWIVAAAKAFLNSSLLPIWPKLTIVFVIVVPRFEPITIGTAMLTGSPPATKPTIIDVTVLDDWIKAVAIIPTIKPAKGLVAKVNNSSALSPTLSLKPELIKVTATIRK